jgi:hypothetical protein
MIKKVAWILLLLSILGPSAAWGDDWKARLVSRLARPPDYAGAMAVLEGQLPALEAEDLQTASALQAFLAAKLGDPDRERALAAAYFEKYRDNDPDIGFLDLASLHDFVNFWGSWKSTYPLVSEVNFLSYSSDPKGSPPAAIDIGLELLNGAYYRISLGPYVLEGGRWARGFHILTVPVADLFGRSGSYEFLLDLKSGDLVVRKPLKIVIDVTDSPAPAPAPARLPAFEDSRKPTPGPPAASSMTGEIDLYVGDKLILKSRKVPVRIPPTEFHIGGPLMPGQKPYMPPPKNDPMASGVSVLDALALTYKAVKDLFAKKPPKPSPPAYQKVSSLTFSFARARAEGGPAPARAVIRLEPGPGGILRE